jgi:tRNA1(Val) A37 N6-methylase TrmN6
VSQFPTEKYLFKPYPYSSHSMIISWLEKFPKGTRILDVGTATE